MNKEAPKKGAFILIIVLLVIFAPLSIISFALHIMSSNNQNQELVNVNHDFYYQGKLYFYNDDTLLGTYTCKSSKEFCGYVKSKSEDEKYAISSYQSLEKEIPVIQDHYVFLVDGEGSKPFLYDIGLNKSLITYDLVNNYNIGLEQERFIVKNEQGKYGVLGLLGQIQIIVPYEYDFIGSVDFIDSDSGLLMADNFVALKDGMWYLIGNQGAILTEPVSKEIVSYTGQYIIIKDMERYSLINYQNEQVLESDYTWLSFTGRYLNVIDLDYDFYVYDLVHNTMLIDPIPVLDTDKMTSKISEEGKLEIIQNDNVIQVVEIS